MKMDRYEESAVLFRLTLGGMIVMAAIIIISDLLK